MDLKLLGRRLQKLRIEKFGSKSVAQFEEKSGVSRGSVYAIERGIGKDGPAVNTVEKWLKACDKSLADFFGSPQREDFTLPFDYDPDYLEQFRDLSAIVNSGDTTRIGAARIYLFDTATAARASQRSPPPSKNEWVNVGIIEDRRHSNGNGDRRRKHNRPA